MVISSVSLVLVNQTRLIGDELSSIRLATAMKRFIETRSSWSVIKVAMLPAEA